MLGVAASPTVETGSRRNISAPARRAARDAIPVDTAVSGAEIGAMPAQSVNALQRNRRVEHFGPEIAAVALLGILACQTRPPGSATLSPPDTARQTREILEGYTADRDFKNDYRFIGLTIHDDR